MHPVEREELKILLARYFQNLENDDQTSLESIENLEVAIKFLFNPHISEMFRNKVLQKAKDFAKQLSDPRECWEFMDLLDNRVETVSQSLVDCLNAKAGILIKGVTDKQVPEWFLELLKNHAKIPVGFRDVFYKKAEEIQQTLNGNGNSAEVVRTHERKVL